MRTGERAITIRKVSDGSCEAIVPEKGQQIPGRLVPLLQVGRAALTFNTIEEIKLQFHDEAPDIPCLAFDGSWNESGNLLIPDPYCLASNGFERIQQSFVERVLPPWEQRISRLFWRGASTGAKALTIPRMLKLPRYQLCSLSKKNGELIDARFTDVVQTRDREAGLAIRNWLLTQKLTAPRVAPWIFGLHRWLIDIDGNVNSWGLLWKLFSGSCVLRVNSHRRQWFHHRLVPYRHLVPISADLHDLEAKLHWCLDNPKICSSIAREGQKLAMQIADEQGLDLLRAMHFWKQLNQ